jgi:hypothetical protein
MKKARPGEGGGPRKDNDPVNNAPETTPSSSRFASPSEKQIQASVLQHLAWRSVPQLFWFAVPNGEWRSRVTGAILKGQGVTPGTPDLILVHAGRCFGLELKSDAGRLSNSQRETHRRMRAAGAVVATTYGIDESIAQLEQWRLLRGAIRFEGEQ